MLLLRLSTEMCVSAVTTSRLKRTPKTASLVEPRFSLLDGPPGEEVGLRCKSGLFQEHPIADSRGREDSGLLLDLLSLSLQGNAATVLKIRP